MTGAKAQSWQEWNHLIQNTICGIQFLHRWKLNIFGKHARGCEQHMWRGLQNTLSVASTYHWLFKGGGQGPSHVEQTVCVKNVWHVIRWARRTTTFLMDTFWRVVDKMERHTHTHTLARADELERRPQTAYCKFVYLEELLTMFWHMLTQWICFCLSSLHAARRKVVRLSEYPNYISCGSYVRFAISGQDIHGKPMCVCLCAPVPRQRETGRKIKRNRRQRGGERQRARE